MNKKRLIGVVTVRQGWAVQSFGYSRYLPLGKPEVLVENLDRWGADEILLQCMDRSAAGAGPDLELLERVSRQGLSTPLIYAGGIRTVAHGVAAVKAGADRICVDALLHDDLAAAVALGGPLGAQAVIAALPLTHGPDGLQWLDYRNHALKPFDPELAQVLQSGAISEALVIDWQHEGHADAFNPQLLQNLPFHGVPLLSFGGLSNPGQLRRVLQDPAVAAVAIGNFLSYREHAVQKFKDALAGLPLRVATYDDAGA